MAKDVFYRSKPHVNVGILAELQELGLSAVGAQQAAGGQIVTDPNDRDRLAEFLQTAYLPTGKRQHKPMAVRES